MKMKNQHGFTALELILIFVIVGIIGFLGWWVFKTKKEATTSVTTALQPAESTKQSVATKETKPATDETADWTVYSSKEGVFSLKYPKTWVTASNPELCSPGILLIAPTKTAVGKCASEGFGQVAVVSNDGDRQDDEKLTSGYVDVKTVAVTVDGVKGSKITGVAKGQTLQGAVPDGTQVVKYVFFTKNKTYVAQYTKLTEYTDALIDFNLIITKTLKFQP